MNVERWNRICEIYTPALSMRQPDRNAFVAKCCESDTVLEQEVNSLLEADASSGDFLKMSVFETGLKVLLTDSWKDDSTLTTNLDPKIDQLIGLTIDGRYRIERELRHGGVGAVYLGRDHRLHEKPIVVKVLLEKSLRNEWVVQKFLQEKEALARVDHPGVVGILDTGELPDGKPYIVMQYVDGETLRDAMRDKREGMDLERVALIVEQIGAALSAVHERSIYHRDLKPENIMLQALGRGAEQVKIVDFGIAKIKESVVAPSTITGGVTAGTIVYMSPEQLHGDTVSAPSDIYSFGVIAYELITGRRPFNPDTIAQLSDMQREGVRVMPTDLRPRLPDRAQATILKALAFNPKARYQHADEFGEALSRCLMNEEETLKHDLKAVIAPQATLLSVETGSLMPPAESTILNVFEQAPIHPAKYERSIEWSQTIWPKLAIGLVLIVALLLGAFLLVTKRPDLFGTRVDSGTLAQRSLQYSLTVQKMRDGKPYKDPFVSSGQEIFENGYKFRLNVASAQSGFLYVFNEGADNNSALSFTIIYPTPATNKGSAKLDSNQTMETNWNTFAGQAGTEQFWIVWSGSQISEMEAARDAAFRNEEGALTDAAMVRTVKEFLTKHSDPKPVTTKDSMKQQTDVRVDGDLLIKLVELEHR